ncbi:LOW QUALITY PROTEIN: Phosphatidylinositol N- acetylglucosaminyltransferase subunit H [Babesia divergens]|uniref:Phosphatidylinositol N-acetylglucosaminyltransferase subunit H n=1 Tax=Babesia divergens TaxID=32595 RepID=A0AAD9GFE2_BABDI|nr:LOW QUALITY PROTEIN: Phosphatidylinositol N- acetylglucosaminyltransferase subunit H [Babesia divergens]
MDRHFSMEKWPSGYVFTSKCRSRLYGSFLKLLNAVRWLPIIYAVRHYLSNILWWSVMGFVAIEILNNIYVTQERLIMLRGYGLQLEALTLTGRKSIRTIPICEIDQLLINEAILMNEVIFYMVISLKNSDELVLSFNLDMESLRLTQNAIPRLEALKTIYRTFNRVFPSHSRDMDSKPVEGNLVKEAN